MNQGLKHLRLQSRIQHHLPNLYNLFILSMLFFFCFHFFRRGRCHFIAGVLWQCWNLLTLGKDLSRGRVV